MSFTSHQVYKSICVSLTMVAVSCGWWCWMAVALWMVVVVQREGVAWYGRAIAAVRCFIGSAARMQVLS